MSNRSSDNGFYVAPGGGLQVWPVAAGADPVTQDEWHHVTLTNDGTTVIGYLDGVFQFDLATASMDFSSYAGANPDRLIHFFADNLLGGGTQEFADGSVALIRLYDIALDPDDVGNLPPTAAASPASLALFATGLLLFASMRRRAKAV